MNSNNSALKYYIRSVSEELPCSGKMRKHIVSQIYESVEDYLFQNPNADFETIQSRFGTPQEIAASCVNDQEALMLMKKAALKKKVFAIIAGTVAAILLLWVGSVAWATIDTQKMTNGHIGVTFETN